MSAIIKTPSPSSEESPRREPLGSLVERMLRHKSQNASTSVLLREQESKDWPGEALALALRAKVQEQGSTPFVFQMWYGQVHGRDIWNDVANAAANGNNTMAIVLVERVDRVAPFAEYLNHRLVQDVMSRNAASVACHWYNIQGDLLLHHSLQRILRISNVITVFTVHRDAIISDFAMDRVSFFVNSVELEPAGKASDSTAGGA
jgi:hypothetical protein